MQAGVISDVEKFIARNSRDGMFLRFARARARGFLIRQTMTVTGAVSLAMLISPRLGLLAAALALLGETVDCLLLFSLYRRFQGGAVPQNARRLAMLSGTLQAMTIAACVMICWHGGGAEPARFFAAAFLMSAAINAGLVRRHFPAGAHLRLAVYALTGAALVASDLQSGGPQGNEHWFLVIAMLIMAYTATLFIRAVERGQTERLMFEQALLEERSELVAARAEAAEAACKAERLALVAQHANDSVIFTSPQGRIEWVNAAFSRITGYSFDEAVGRHPGEILNAEDTNLAAEATLHAAQRNATSARVEILNRTRDGRHIWMEISMTPVLRPDGSPDVFIAVERDITQAKAHAAELALAREAAEAAAKAKSQFLATMSHEIRTPMNGVIGVAELLEETALDKGQRHYVRTIIESSRALLTIINDVLDLSKLQAGKVDLLAEPFSIAESVGRALDILRPTALKKGLSIAADLPADPLLYLGDSGRLRQILLNLLGNAVKFTARGNVRVSVQTLAQPKRDVIRIAIADSGIGIAADRIGHVFESFAQADNTISRLFGGTGLGLTISRLLAQQMGGDIEVESTLGQGSVFTIVLRLPKARDTVRLALAAHKAPQTALRVLVAEDNRTNMLITRKLLERSVVAIAEADNGRQAVAAYCTDPPDLVLMDVSMPEMTGHEATREIRAFEAAQNLSRCPIIALTAYASQDEAVLCLASGMDGVLTKPLVRAELYSLLERTAIERDGFDLAHKNAVDREAKGGLTWSTSPRASGVTSGRSTRSSAL